MNLKGKVDKLLEEARAGAGAEEEARRNEEWWAAFEARLNAEVAAFVARCPDDLQDRVIEHLNAATERWNAGELDRAGLLPWLDRRTRFPEHNPPTPWPAGEVPAWPLLACLDGGAWMDLECGDCGHQQPAVLPQGGSFLQPVRQECWACGGPVGLLAWHHALHEAVKGLAWEWQRRTHPPHKTGPLQLLVELGYRPAERLSAWLSRRR